MPVLLTAEQTEQVVGLIRAGEYIQAVKLYRQCAGCDLKAAKDAVDTLRAENAASAPHELKLGYASPQAARGLPVGWIVAALLVGAAVLLFGLFGWQYQSSPVRMVAQRPIQPVGAHVHPARQDDGKAAKRSASRSPTDAAKTSLTPLMAALTNGQLAAAKAIIESSSDDINAVSSDGQKFTALLCASGIGRDRGLEIVQMLVEKGAEVNHRSTGGYTALMRAVRVHSPKTVEYLLQQGADVNIVSVKGETALDWARQSPRNDTQIVTALTAAGARSGKEPTTMPQQ